MCFVACDCANIYTIHKVTYHVRVRTANATEKREATEKKIVYEHCMVYVSISKVNRGLIASSDGRIQHVRNTNFSCQRKALRMHVAIFWSKIDMKDK